MAKGEEIVKSVGEKLKVDGEPEFSGGFWKRSVACFGIVEHSSLALTRCCSFGTQIVTKWDLDEPRTWWEKW